MHTSLVHEEKHSLTTLCWVGLCLVLKETGGNKLSEKKAQQSQHLCLQHRSIKDIVSFDSCVVWFDRSVSNMNNLVIHKDSKREREEGKSDGDWCVCERK